MPYIERSNEPTLHYELDDYTDSWNNAGVIVLQHGFSRSSKFWYPWVPYLSRFYRVVRPDMRGKGKSAIPANIEKEQTADRLLADLDAIIDHLGVDSVHYCGESLGGLLGMIFAARRPQRIRTLTLVGAPPYISDHDKTSTTYGFSSRIEALQKMGTKAWVKASSAGRRFPPDVHPGMIDWFDAEMGKGNLDVLVTMTRWIFNTTAVADLPKIQAPVLGLYPAEGTVVAGDQLNMLRKNITNFKLVNVPTQYHAIASFMPATCALQLLHFAAQHDGIVCHES